MKKLFVLAALALACSFSSMAADECCAGTEVAVQQRLRDIDLNIALKKYEQIQTEKAKAELQLVLVETEIEAPEGDRKRQYEQLQKRVDILTAHADHVRAYILKLSKDLSVASN